MRKWYLVTKNYKVSYIFVLCGEMKSQGQESDNIMLCLVFDTDHLYALVISSVCVSFYICKWAECQLCLFQMNLHKSDLSIHENTLYAVKCYEA